MEFRTKLRSDGRIVLPVQCRKALNLSSGDEVIIQIEEEHEARLLGVQQAIKRVQKEVQKYTKGKKNLVEQLIKMRREEAKNE